MLLSFQDCTFYPGSMFALGTGLTFIIIGQYRLHLNQHDSTAYRAIIPGLHGYVFLMTAIILHNHPSWVIPMAIFISLYMMVLSNRPERTQI